MPGSRRSPSPRFRSRSSIIFERFSVSLWAEDISALRTMIRQWQAEGIRDLRAYLAGHPAAVRRAVRAIRVVDVNSATLRLYEAARKEDLVGRLAVSLDPDTMRGRIELIAAISEGRSEVELEATTLTLTGKKLDVLAKSYIPAEGDADQYMLVSIVDLTERKRLESRVRQERSLLLSLINNSPDVFFYKDTEGRFLLANRAFADLTGLRDPVDALGKDDFDLVPRDIAERYRADDRRVIETGQPSAEMEEQFIRKDGSERWLLTKKVPIFDAADRVIGVLGIARDITERKRSEAALSRERTFLKALMDTIPDHIYFKDRQSRFVMNNKAQARDLGAGDPQEMVGKSDFDYFEQPFAQKAYDDEQRIIRTGEPLINEMEGHLWADRPHVWITSTKLPLRNERGEIIGTFGVSRDVTEHKRAMEALEEARRYAESLIRTASIMVIGFDNNLRLTEFNDMAEKITGYSRAELEGRFLFEVLTPADRYPDAWARMRTLMRGGLPEVFESPLLTKAGEERYVIWHNSKVLRNGAVVGSIAFGLDVTDRRRAEETNILLATLVKSSHDAIISVDADARVTTWNTGAELVYGYSAAEMIGRTADTVIPPGRRAETQEIRRRVLRGEVVADHETERIRKDGRRIIVRVTFSPVRDALGNVIGIASISSDITEQKALQAQLIRAQRLESLATLAGGIAHQFNNINTVALGYLDLLARDSSLSEGARQYLAAVQESVQRAIAITERLQGLTASAQSALEEIDLAELARSLIPLFEKRFEADGVDVAVDFKEPARALANRSILGFVMGNLLTNSLHALMDRPVRLITIRTRASPGLAGLEVNDTGCGIPPANLSRIFTPFFTTKGEWAEPGSVQARVKGVGLSLAVSQSAIAELGGRIEVESLPGEGSTFRLWLPALSGPPESER